MGRKHRRTEIVVHDTETAVALGCVKLTGYAIALPFVAPVWLTAKTVKGTVWAVDQVRRGDTRREQRLAREANRPAPQPAPEGETFREKVGRWNRPAQWDPAQGRTPAERRAAAEQRQESPARRNTSQAAISDRR